MRQGHGVPLSPAVSSAAQTHARPAPDGGDTQPRPKRTKYTSLACNECKKRKLKCIRSTDEAECQRCVVQGVPCTFRQPPARQSEGNDSKKTDKPKEKSSIDPNQQLTNDVALLREQVSALGETVKDLASKTPAPGYSPTSSQRQGSDGEATKWQRGGPRQPRFIGPTRSAFSLGVAESSLNRMGIPSAPKSPAGTGTGESFHASFAREETPEVEPGQVRPEARRIECDSPLAISVTEVVRLLQVFEEEIESVYPFIETRHLAANAPSIRGVECRSTTDENDEINPWDLEMIKVAVAVAIVIEVHGKNDTSTRLVESTTPLRQSTVDAEVSLKTVQILALLSIYYFLIDEELLAWRTIGIAARHTLELGLHRKQSLLDNFAEEEGLAIRVFWCVYTLDRRWSFGTSLSFALCDRDIDKELPEPGEDHQYLRCMIGYARLCSQVWEALPPSGSPLQTMPRDTAAFLDFMIQNWLNSIPDELQLRHLQPGVTSTQPRTLQRLRALLYVRANHLRTLIHRHHVMSSANISADLPGARLVVDAAKDTIHVLVNLSATSDIYVRQQSPFNYFLLSALATILLAVCHTPSIFAEPCREPFHAAVELVKSFSQKGTASRRLWRSIRGLVPGVNSLGLRREQHGESQPNSCTSQGDGNHFSAQYNPAEYTTGDGFVPQYDAMPNMYTMSNDLLSIFNTFGQTAGGALSDVGPDLIDPQHQGPLGWDNDDILQRFQMLM